MNFTLFPCVIFLKKGNTDEYSNKRGLRFYRQASYRVPYRSGTPGSPSGERSMFREGTSGHLIQALSHCDVIINLAGAPISKRWTPEYKKELYDSRIKVTHCIIRAMDAVKTKRG